MQLSKGRSRSCRRGRFRTHLVLETLELRRVLTSFLVTSGADAGPGSLREAVQLANASPGPDVIEFDAAIPGGAIHLSTAELSITDSVTLDAGALALRLDIDTTAADPTPTVRDGMGIRAMAIDDGNNASASVVELRNIRILGGDVLGSGGAIESRESLVLEDVVFAANHATLSGGAIQATIDPGGQFVMRSSQVSGNHAGTDGAGVDLDLPSGSTGSIAGSYFSFNYAGRNGGALSAEVGSNSTLDVEETTAFANAAEGRGGGFDITTGLYGHARISNSFISGNTALGAGGGVASYALTSGQFTISASSITSNAAGAKGGGWYGRSYYYGESTVTGSFVNGNSADDNGGGIAVHSSIGGRVELSQTEVGTNHSDGAGGGIFTRSGLQGHFMLHNSAVSGNTAGASGGGLMLDNDHSATGSVTGSSFSDNFGIRGGGLFADASGYGQVTVADSTATGNTAFAGGGGFYGMAADHGLITMKRLQATSNKTMEEIGGGIGARAFVNGRIDISASITTGNKALLGGGIALFLNGGEASVTSSTAENNTARGSGGGISINGFGTSTALIDRSTVSANSSSSNGGGIWSVATDGTIDIRNSTVSGNTAHQWGGGVYVADATPATSNTSLRHLTVAANYAGSNPIGTGGGVRAGSLSQPILTNSIIADNFVGGVSGDLSGEFYADYNLIESPEVVTLTGSGNLTGIDPELQPLDENGGPTKTHSISVTSAALNSGDPAFAAPPAIDQRGFARVAMGRIDRGAVELQAVVDGDFDDDGDHDLTDLDALVAAIIDGGNDLAFDLTQDTLVDLADRDAWLVTAGAINLGPGRVYLLGDADLDGNVDGDDFFAWDSNKFTSGALWSGADFNADGVTNGRDFLIWNANKLTSSELPDAKQRTELESRRRLRRASTDVALAALLQPMSELNSLGGYHTGQ